MHIRSLRLRAFRNYGKASLTFSPESNLFTGDNAQGKTNLIEALYLLITGRSFRTPRLTDMIQSGKEGFFVEAAFEKNGISQTLSIGIGGSEKKLFHNATSLPVLSHLFGLLQGVLLCPEDRALVAGAPALRRRFLDIHLAQLDPLYIHAFSRYMRALKHRNHLLRSKNRATLSAWEAHLAKEGALITKARIKAARELGQPLQETHDKLTGGSDLATLSYKPTLTTNPEENEKAYHKARSRELLIGHTLIGPHRDELLISVGEQEARLFGSEGQKMSCVASLRLAEWERLRTCSGEVPLLLVDDLGLGLDPKRRAALQELIEEKGQVFATHPQEIPFRRTSCHYQITSGMAQGRGRAPLARL